MRGAAAGLAAAPLQPSPKWFGLAWGKPPSLGSQALGWVGVYPKSMCICWCSNALWTKLWLLLKKGLWWAPVGSQAPTPT